MEKMLCDSPPAIGAAAIQGSPDPVTAGNGFEAVTGLELQQRRQLDRIGQRGVFWKLPDGSGMAFRLAHGGDVESDGNCLFTAAARAAGAGAGAALELRRRTVRRFLEDAGCDDVAVKNLYSPDLTTGWGVHVVQEVKMIVRKEERVGLDAAIQEMVDLGLQRESAAESVYKERCIQVNDGPSWAKYMSISGSPEDEYDIITIQYTEEGLLTVDENRDGHAGAFGDDIAIESLAMEFKREVYVVQAHGSDAMIDEENCVFSSHIVHEAKFVDLQSFFL